MKIAVFFGGKSCEHNISVITGIQTMRALKQKHEVFPVFIDGEGRFFTGKDLTGFDAVSKKSKVKRRPLSFIPSSGALHTVDGKLVSRIDAAVLCTHGYGGEDGCLQGLLTLCGIPFTGSGVSASALGMNKVLMKKIFEREKLPVLPYAVFRADEYRDDLFSVVERIKTSLKFPMIVKPAGGGSSIGISVAHDYPELFEAIKIAVGFDNVVVVENALTNFTELNCAAIGVGGDIAVSEIEQPLSASGFLSFEDKYVFKTKRDAGAKRIFPAGLPPEIVKKVKGFTQRAFKALGAAGVARADYLLDGETLYINEINTIPGALSNYLFSAGAHKLSFIELLDRMIEIALKVKKDADGLKYAYESSYVLNPAGKA
jgi:D-alanine-D-alanine ligase